MQTNFARTLLPVLLVAASCGTSHEGTNDAAADRSGDGGARSGAGGAAGARGTGGATSTGGATGAGGAAGATGAGGVAGARGTGGATSTGGATGAGGAAGATGTGGAPGAGGSPGTGGAPGAGGALGTGGAGGVGSATRGPLRVHPTNPRYFADATGKVVFLTGSHTWGNFRDRALTDPPPPFDFGRYLDFLAAHNHNFFRLWTWEQPRSWNNNTDNMKRYFTPFPWPRTGPGMASDGKPRFDLSQLDQAYFDRMRTRVAAAGARGMYVAVTLFDGWDLANAYNPDDGGFPYGANNNVNGIASGGPESQTLANSAVTAIQDAYVRKVIDTVNDLDNVLYEIANETNASGVAWQYHMVDLIKQVEAGKPMAHPVGMTSTYPGSDSDLYASHADWIAPNGKLVAGDGRKVVINDTDHSYYWTSLRSDGPAAQRAWAWQTLTIGASAAFMDPYLEDWGGRNSPAGGNVDPYWETLRTAMGDAHRYADRLDLAHALPAPSAASTGYCLAYPDHQYLVFQGGSGAFTLTVGAGTYNYEWFNPVTGAVAGTGTMTLAAGSRTFTPPTSGPAVLLLFL